MLFLLLALDFRFGFIRIEDRKKIPVKKIHYHPETLLENRRLSQLKKMVDNFEAFYRAEKGQVVCQVTSPAELSAPEKMKVIC